MTTRNSPRLSLTTGLFMLGLFVTSAQSAIRDLYNSKEAKSDLKWAAHPFEGGWEEVSGLDENAKTIRTLQVCNNDHPNNWIRSPFIRSESAQRVYIDIEYSMLKDDNYRETFTLYYYQSDLDVASSTFPPWKERPYVKIDTVAAGNRFDAGSESNGGINHKTFSIGPLIRNGFYIAAQDQGACMSILGMRIYYRLCPEITYGLSYFPKTLPGAKVASLVPVNGKCVSNGVYHNGEVPKYRCNSNGEWNVPTGLCQCRAGYYANSDLTTCDPCSIGYYKSVTGNEACQICPPRSTSHAVGSAICHCELGFYRAAKDSIDQSCTRPPSSPTSVSLKVNKTSAIVQWNPPSSDGGRSDVYYSASCSECDAAYKNCRPCPSNTRLEPRDHRHLTDGMVKIEGLEMFQYYRLKISSHNGVSSVSKEPAQYEIIEFSTNEGVPSTVSHMRRLDGSSNSLTISWLPPAQLAEEVTGYDVYAVALPKKQSGMARPNFAPILLTTTLTNITFYDLYPSTNYEVKVRAKAGTNVGRYSKTVIFSTAEKKTSPKIDEPSSGTGLIIGVIAGVVTVLVIVIIIVVVMRRRRANDVRRQEDQRALAKMAATSDERQNLTDSGGFGDSLVASGQARTTYTDYRDPHKGVAEIAREIDFTSIKIDRVIGQGEFGEVCRGKLTTGKKETIVAVKRLKRGATLIDQTNLLREACTMAQFSDPNILQLKGVVTKTMPIMIISEFMENGSLDRYLLANRGQFSVLQLVNMLHGIASGMRYLADMQYVHRDLAARNILVNTDRVCKVSDFGLSRNLENDPHATYTTQGGKIPIRWTAPECFRYRRFTTSSDAWSYGIVMWEVMSYGEKPYWEMTNEHVTESIEDGFRLPAPQDCPQALHRVMLDCWSYDAPARPTFREIFVRMRRFIQQPDLLIDREPITDASAAFLDPESPSDFTQQPLTMEEWLELWKLGSYCQSFKDNGIRHLDEVVNLTPDDIDRLGITQNVHRIRLQSGIQTLRRHLSDEHSGGAATLPMPGNMTQNGPASPGVVMETAPRGAVGVGPPNTVSYHQRGALNV